MSKTVYALRAPAGAGPARGLIRRLQRSWRTLGLGPRETIDPVSGPHAEPFRGTIWAPPSPRVCQSCRPAPRRIGAALPTHLAEQRRDRQMTGRHSKRSRVRRPATLRPHPELVEGRGRPPTLPRLVLRQAQDEATAELQPGGLARRTITAERPPAPIATSASGAQHDALPKGEFLGPRRYVLSTLSGRIQLPAFVKRYGLKYLAREMFNAATPTFDRCCKFSTATESPD